MSTPPIASSYLNQHRILPLFEGLTSLLVYSQPKDPRAFMIDALKKIKEKNAFPYRPQDLDFLFPALAAAPDEVATSTKPSVDAAATHQREHAPVSKGPAAGNAHGETPNAKPASRGKEEAKLSDQELAAAKIQATYRGHAVRKDIKEQSPNGPQDEPKKTSPVESKAEKPADANPSEDEAALKIQAAYRGHSVRKELKNGSQGEKENPSKGATPTETSTAGPSLDEDEAAAKIQAAYRGHSVRKELKNGSQNGSENVSKGVTPTETSNAGPSLDEDEAALKIQAAYRGHAVRKELKSGGSGRGSDAVEQKAEEQVVDDESSKPSDEEAATKIQSVYRGHRVRKEMQGSNNEQSSNTKTPTPQFLAPPGVDENLAATKIQAVYRGHNVRKTMPQGSFKAGVLMMDQQPEDAIAADADAQEKDSADAAGGDSNSDLDQAAIRIQAVYRGHIVRKQMVGIPESSEDAAANAEENGLAPNDAGEVIATTETTPGIAVDNIDNPDEAERAATRIQASYRGYRTRKELGKDKEEGQAE